MRTTFGVDPVHTYFEEQSHSNLTSFVDSVAHGWSDELGFQIVALTFAPFTSMSTSTLATATRKVTAISLHELSSERDLQQQAKDFFSAPTDRDHLLLIRCDPLAASVQRFEHAKFVCPLYVWVLLVFVCLFGCAL